MKSVDMDYSQRDLFHAIEKGDFPKWRGAVQIMPEEEAATYHINPFDLTKVWPHSDYPLHRSRRAGARPQPGELLRRSGAGGVRARRTSCPAWASRRTRCCRGG